MFNFLKCKIIIPNGDTEEIQGLATYIVSWTKRNGEYSTDTKKCYQAFTNQDEAIKFKKSLEDAHRLIGNTSGTKVTIEKQVSGL